MSHGVREAVWIRCFLNKLLSKQAVRRIEMLKDNETSLILTKYLKSQNCIRHKDVIYHYMRGLVDDEKLEIEWIPSLLILANGFTKALPKGLFK